MTNKQKEYWQTRINDIFDENHKQKLIAEIYRISYKTVEKDILKLYDELISSGELTTTQLYQYERFTTLQNSINKQSVEIKTTLNKEVTDTLTKAYKGTFGTVNGMLGINQTWGIQNNIMLKSVLNTSWKGSHFSKRIWGNTDILAQRIEANVIDCLTRGTSKDIYVSTIKNTYDVGFNKADRLVRTELSNCINKAQIDTFKQSKFIDKVEWSVEFDGRECNLCSPMDGNKYSIEEFGNGIEYIKHPNCRCCLIPVVDNITKI